MNKSFPKLSIATALLVGLFACDQGLNFNSDSLSTKQLDVAQISAQLASGTSFRIAGSSTDSIANAGPHHGGPGGPHGPHGRPPHPLDGLSLLPPTDELLAVTDAESAGDFRGLRMFGQNGARVTNYDASGQTMNVTAPTTQAGPQGCSNSVGQFPAFDALISSVAKTEIDFGSGVTYKRDTISITRAGKIIITRTGDTNSLTEKIVFENYSVNGIKIEGTKTRVSTFDGATSKGKSRTLVGNGSLTFADGTTAKWTTERSRTSDLTFDDHGRPVSGTITTNVSTSVTTSSGDVIYSHKTTSPLIEDITCRRRPAPLSGTIETNYKSDKIVIDFGDGSCTNQTITITINGVVSTKTIGV